MEEGLDIEAMPESELNEFWLKLGLGRAGWAFLSSPTTLFWSKLLSAEPTDWVSLGAGKKGQLRTGGP